MTYQNFDPTAAQMVCCVCGARLPVLENRRAYLDKHCACIMPDGSIRYYCPGTRHSAQEIDEAIHGLPAFTTGRILKERQRLI